MKIRKSKISAAAIAMMLLVSAYTGCSPTDNVLDSSSDTTASSISAKEISNTSGVATTVADNLKDEDIDSAWDAATSTQIALTGTTADISGNGAAASGGTVTITEAGTYVVSGTLSKGQILINAGEKDTVRLVLNGADITADTNAAIYAAAADKLVVILAEGTTNTVTDVAAYTYTDTEKEEPNAAIFSKCDLSINGTGSLTVNGSFNHGIATKDDLIIASGNITVQSVGASIRGKDSVTILDGIFNLTSSDGDGIKSENETDADKGWVLIQGGTVNIKGSVEGIEGANINITGGKINIYATDDGININDASGLLTISGGEIYVNADGDGIDSNNQVVMTGGTVYVDGPTSSGNGAIDFDKSFEINGGTLIAVDNGGMSQAPSMASAQPSILLSYASTQTAGTEISLQSSDGTTLFSYAPQKDYRAVVISTGDMKLNEAYTIYSGETKLCDVTLSSSVTSIDSTGAAAAGRGGMGGGFGGGRGGAQMPDGAEPPARPDGGNMPAPPDGTDAPPERPARTN